MTASGFTSRKQEEVYDSVIDSILGLVSNKIVDLMSLVSDLNIDLFNQEVKGMPHKEWSRNLMEQIKVLCKMEKNKQT